MISSVLAASFPSAFSAQSNVQTSLVPHGARVLVLDAPRETGLECAGEEKGLQVQGRKGGITSQRLIPSWWPLRLCGSLLAFPYLFAVSSTNFLRLDGPWVKNEAG
ncbi:uncharacterized protein STEHIDRAFT_116947 [Stereum hirsutum FP-91666 SS1]|uniref:uncharacterized protein n=1 Tax=Stereum hirsutum (strain FP-91666) TaxID=721885 RepID=UPI000440C530|nr:uncharacterized protein STEHIDRAFT_116947 [Stereum hirsutum FP-91666 SS1]EIM91815.1 hypothetical protein STEHIDRAFT_116947 [Stereum hirsutum FP-91666 SS1]